MNIPYMDPSDLMDPIQQQQAVVEIALELVESCQAGWKEIEFEIESLSGVASSRKWVVRENDEKKIERFPTSVANKALKLRTGMYQDDTGTWLSMSLHILPPGKYKVDFNYDEEPAYMFPPPPQDFFDDLTEFPRTADNIPDWLQQKLRQLYEG